MMIKKFFIGENLCIEIKLPIGQRRTIPFNRIQYIEEDGYGGDAVIHLDDEVVDTQLNYESFMTELQNQVWGSGAK